MKRRDFLKIAATLGPAAGFRGRAADRADCPRPFTWKTRAQAVAPSDSPVVAAINLCPRPPDLFDTFPPRNETCIDFKPPGGRIVKRPLWSELQSSDSKYRRFTDALLTGYHAMLQRSSVNPHDPTGLLYQTWLHDFYCGGGWSTDVHETWDFLPWHRAFIYFHEKMIAKAAKWRDFRLPAWDWDRPGKAVIPDFYNKDLGLPSYLSGGYRRQPNLLASAPWLTQCALQAWIFSELFEDFCGSATAEPRARWGPHNIGHAGLTGGAMKSPVTSAADPIFYSHHVNVDRFWQHWQKVYKNLRPPQGWGDQLYYFHDENSNLVSVRASAMERTALLGYDYGGEPNLALDLSNLPVTHLWSRPADIRDALIEMWRSHLAANVGSSQQAEFEEFIRSPAKSPPGDVLERAMLGARLRLQVENPETQPAIESGKYYLVQLWRGGAHRTIGGFGVFSHEHGGSPKEIEVASCADPLLYQTIAQGSGELQVVCGVADTDGFNIITFDPVTHKKIPPIALKVTGIHVLAPKKMAITEKLQQLIPALRKSGWPLIP